MNFKKALQSVPICFLLGGTTILKCGSLLFGIKEFINNIIFKNESSEKNTNTAFAVGIIAVWSTAHVIISTRGASMWRLLYGEDEKNNKSLQNIPKERELKCVKIFSGGLAILSGIGLIPILSYVGAKEILDFITIDDSIPVYSFFAYCLLSDMVAYFSFTTKITMKNTVRLVNDFIYNKNKQDSNPLHFYKTVVVSLLGLISNISFNYFLARSAISNKIHDKESSVDFMSATISILSGIVTFLSKSGEVYNFFAKKEPEIINSNISHSDEIILFYHKAIGSAYINCFMLSYYSSCIRNYDHFGVDFTDIRQRIPLELVAILTSMSAGYMEYALSYRIMIRESKKRISLEMEQVGIFAISSHATNQISFQQSLLGKDTTSLNIQ